MQLCMLPPFPLSLTGWRIRAEFWGRIQRSFVLHPLLSRFTASRMRVNSHSLRVYIIIKARLHGRLRRRCYRRISIRNPVPRCWKKMAINLTAMALTYLISTRFVSNYHINNANLLIMHIYLFIYLFIFIRIVLKFKYTSFQYFIYIFQYFF